MANLRVPREVTQLLANEDLDSEAYELLGQLFATFAHDLSQPMAWILTNLDFVLNDITKSDHRLDEPVLASLHDAHHGATVMLQLLRDVRCFVASNVTETDLIALSEPVDTAVRLCNRHLKVNEVSVEVSVPTNTYVNSNQAVIIRVLCNLLANASQAFASHGRTEHRRIRVTSRSQGSSVELRVADNGPGISEEHLGRIFDSGFSTKPGGSGIGLFSARASLERVGGTLTVDRSSAAGDGAAFVLTLPYN